MHPRELPVIVWWVQSRHTWVVMWSRVLDKGLMDSPLKGKLTQSTSVIQRLVNVLGDSAEVSVHEHLTECDLKRSEGTLLF